MKLLLHNLLTRVNAVILENHFTLFMEYGKFCALSEDVAVGAHPKRHTFTVFLLRVLTVLFPLSVGILLSFFPSFVCNKI
jgi:hypothetical protein